MKTYCPWCMSGNRGEVMRQDLGLICMNSFHTERVRVAKKLRVVVSRVDVFDVDRDADEPRSIDQQVSDVTQSMTLSHQCRIASSWHTDIEEITS